MILDRERKSRWILWVLGAGAAAAVVALAVSWQDILVRYHLEALRRNPQAFLSFLDAPAGTAKNRALEEFVREPRGQQAVVSRFLEDFEQARKEDLVQLQSRVGRGYRPVEHEALGELDAALVGFRGTAPGRRRFAFWLEFHCGWGMEGGRYFDCPDDSYIVSLSKLLKKCRGVSLELPRYPSLRVEVLSLESAIARARSWPPTGIESLRPRGSFSGSPLGDPESPQDCALLISTVK